MLGAAAGEQNRVPALGRAVDGDAAHRHGARRRGSRCSIGVSTSGGIGRRPVSQSARSTSGKFQHFLKRIHLGVRQRGESRADVAADQQIVLVRAAVRGAEQQTTPAHGRVWISISGIGALAYSGTPAQCQPMEQDKLAPLFAPLTSLAGVGDALATLIARAPGRIARRRPAVSSARKLHRPTRTPQLARRADRPRSATFEVEVVRIERPGIAARADAGRGDGRIGLRRACVLQGLSPRRSCLPARACWSPASSTNAGRSSIPTTSCRPTAASALPPIEPVWPLTAGLFAWHLRRPMADRARPLAGAAGMARRGAGAGARTSRRSPTRCAALHAPAEPPSPLAAPPARVRRGAGGSGGARASSAAGCATAPGAR